MAREYLHRPVAHRRWLALALAATLSGCGAFQGPDASTNEHTLCYTRLSSSPAQLQTLAKDACSGTAPHFDKEAMDIGACPLLTPERVYFGCAEQ
jgi:hypothetical protein